MPIVECGFPHSQAPAPVDALVYLGPTIFVDIGLDPSMFGQGDPASADLTLVLPMQGVPALVDTGAWESCIDEQLAQRLQLPLVDQQVTGGVGGQSTLNVYLANIAIPLLGILQYGRFAGARLAEGGSPHRAIIGRTLLRDALLVYDGPSGSVKLAK